MKIIPNNLYSLSVTFDAINLFGVMFVRKGKGSDNREINKAREHSHSTDERNVYIFFYMVWSRVVDKGYSSTTAP